MIDRDPASERPSLSKRFLRGLGLAARDSDNFESETRQPDFTLAYEGSHRAYRGYIEKRKRGPIASAELIMSPLGSTRIITQQVYSNRSRGVVISESIVIDPALKIASGDGVSTGMCHSIEHGTDVDPSGALRYFTEYRGSTSIRERFGTKRGESTEIDDTIDLKQSTEIATLEPCTLAAPFKSEGFTTSTSYTLAERYRAILDCTKDNRPRQ